MSVIEVQHLIKEFPLPGRSSQKLTAVNDVTFSVEQGEVFGFLGPNGAGKTTTLEIIEGLQPPTRGTTSVLGHDSHRETTAVKQRIGIQLQSSSFYDYLTLTEILNLFGEFYPKRKDAEELLRIVELTEKKDALVKQLSGGQQQRFSIAVSLVNDPHIVFLDEPTTGLDPQARRLMWEFIRRINKQGTTIVLTTHYMEEAEELCDRVGVIDHGKIIALDTPERLIDQLDASAHLEFRLQRDVDPKEFMPIQGVIESRHNGEQQTFSLKISHASTVLPPLIRWAEERSMHLEDIVVRRATLEDVFLHLTGSKLRD